MNKNSKAAKKQSGFSLIELMIVVAIIGILAGVAYPSYINEVNKTKRASAATSILECASILERRFTVSQTYTTNACDNVANESYDITITLSNSTACQSANGNFNCFVITATANNTSDKECNKLTYSHLGLKGAIKSDSSAGDSATCWRTG